MLIWVAVAIAVTCVFAFIIARVWRSKLYSGTKRVDSEAPERILRTWPLAPESRPEYVQVWSALLSRIEQDPEVAIREADNLLQRAMRECGYPTGDFGRVVDKVTLEQLDVLDHYRAAHWLSVKGETTVLSDEEVKRAVTALRAVYDILVK